MYICYLVTVPDSTSTPTVQFLWTSRSPMALFNNFDETFSYIDRESWQNRKDCWNGEYWWAKHPQYKTWYRIHPFEITEIPSTDPALFYPPGMDK